MNNLNPNKRDAKLDNSNPMGYLLTMETLVIKTTPAFERKAKKMMSSDRLEELFDYLYQNPDSGNIIRGTGGIRKLRWATGKNNKGKSGGVRVLYHYSENILVILITLYPKSEKENVTQAERNQLKQLVPALVKKYREEL